MLTGTEASCFPWKCFSLFEFYERFHVPRCWFHFGEFLIIMLSIHSNSSLLMLLFRNSSIIKIMTAMTIKTSSIRIFMILQLFRKYCQVLFWHFGWYVDDMHDKISQPQLIACCTMEVGVWLSGVTYG